MCARADWAALSLPWRRPVGRPRYRLAREDSHEETGASATTVVGCMIVAFDEARHRVRRLETDRPSIGGSARRLLGAVIAAALVTGCGPWSGGSDEGAAKSVWAGAYCDRAEQKVGEIVGVMVTAGVPNGAKTCDYSSAHGVRVVMTMIPNGAATLDNQPEDSPESTPVYGIGDQAFFVPTMRTLWVRVGGDILWVSIRGTSNTQERAVKVARLFV